jgi:phage terminase large subunit
LNVLSRDAVLYFPHDGVATNNISGKRYIDHWTEAGFDCATPIADSMKQEPKPEVMRSTTIMSAGTPIEMWV